MEHRTIEETKDLIAVAIEVRRQRLDGSAFDPSSIENYQRSRSCGNEWHDWACWFLGYADKLPLYLQRPFLAYVGELQWYRHYHRRAERAIDVFSRIVPEELWEQGKQISCVRR